MLLRDRDTQHLPNPLADISNEHRFSVRILALLEQEAAAMVDGLHPDYRLVREALHFFVHVLDRVHHPREEMIFERMQIQADAETLAIINGLHAGHDELRVSGGELLAAFRRGRRILTWRGRRRQAKRLAGYCGGLRQHMRTEEMQVYEPALRLLKNQDWADIEAELAGLPNAICGVDGLPEYAWLLNRYLNQVALVSTGGFPYAWFDRAASLLERSVHTGIEVTRLPRRMSQVLMATSKETSTHLLAVVAKPRSGLISTRAAFTSGLRGGGAALSLLRDVFRSPQATVASVAGSSTERPPRSLSSEHELMTYGEQPGALKRGLATSWQAAGTSLVLRTAVKPMLAHFPIEAAAWLRKRPGLTAHIPRGLRIKKVKNHGFVGRWFLPRSNAATERTIIYLPGGAFVFPASNGHTKALASLLKSCDAKGLMVDYRLVPEHGFPAPIEDAVAAYRYLLNSGLKPKNIAVAGDSAGGGLCLSLLQALREENLPPPACVACLSPFADLSFSAPSIAFNRWHDAVLPSPFAGRALSLYAGDTSADHPLISPVNADYSGFPPLLIQASSSEVLLDDSLRVARKARAQGVEVELEVWDSLPHAWQVFGQLPEAQTALAHVAAFFSGQFERRNIALKQGPTQASQQSLQDTKAASVAVA